MKDRERKKALALKWYATGLTLAQTAQKAKVSGGFVYNVVKEAGVVRRKGHVVNNTPKEVLELYKTQSADQIAAKLKIPKERVYRFLRISGVEVRSKSAAFKLSVTQGTHTSASIGHKVLTRMLATDTINLTWPEYKKLAVKATAAIVRRYGGHIKGYSVAKRWPEWHIDHQFSIYNGYFVWSSKYECYERRSVPVPIKLLCHPANLRCVRGRVNAVKFKDSTISLSTLKTITKETFHVP